MGAFKMQAYWVSEKGFDNCDISDGTPVHQGNATETSIPVGQKFLNPGPNYFIGKSPFAFCNLQWNLSLWTPWRYEQKNLEAMKKTVNTREW